MKKTILILILGLQLFAQENIIKKSRPDVTSPDEEKIVQNDDDLLNLTFSIPYMNQFHTKTDLTYKDQFGFWGLSFGLEYILTQKNYLSFQLGKASDLFTPVPAPFDCVGEQEEFDVIFSNIRINRQVNDWSFGIGICFERLDWRSLNYSIPQRLINHKPNDGCGLSCMIQYKLWQKYYIGTIYQPMFYNITDHIFDYQYFLSIELGFKRPIIKRKE